MLKWVQALTLVVIFPFLALFATQMLNPLLSEFGSFGQTTIKIIVPVLGIFLLVKVLNIITRGRDEDFA